MILTYKIKHNQNLKEKLAKAQAVALFAIHNRDKLSSKYVSHVGLKSAISNQILRKYGNNKKCKRIKNVNLILPNQSLKVKDNMLIAIPLKLSFDISYLPKFSKINQIELDSKYAFISVEVSEIKPYQTKTVVGLDRNATSHVAVLANLSSGKVLKLGKSCLHIRNKYRNIRVGSQKKQNSFGKTLQNKEARIMKDINHKISKTIIQYCIENKAILVLEDLSGIRKQKSKGKKLNGIVNSWSFYQLEQFLMYKAKIYGVSIVKINPAYTSQDCSKCDSRGNRDGKHFYCDNCKHVEHSDVNAAFNIAKKHLNNRSNIDRDILESTTDGAQRKIPSQIDASKAFSEPPML